MKTYRATALMIISILIVFLLTAPVFGDNDCPAGAIFGQPPHYPEDQSATQASDDGPEEAKLICDNFAGTALIEGIHFWGMHAYSDYGWFPCAEDPMAFEITFYIDSLSRPGREVASYTVVLDAVATGIFYYDNTFELMEYTASFPTVSLTEGWVSIQGKYNPSCWFMWLSSRENLDSFSIQYGGGTNYMPYDFAFCLLGSSSCCIGYTGNVDCSAVEAPDISDITRLIDFLYLSHEPLCCLEEADVDLSGGQPDISDIVRIIDHLYLSHNPLQDCLEK